MLRPRPACPAGAVGPLGAPAASRLALACRSPGTFPLVAPSRRRSTPHGAARTPSPVACVASRIAAAGAGIPLRAARAGTAAPRVTWPVATRISSGPARSPPACADAAAARCGTAVTRCGPVAARTGAARASPHAAR
jgi:hypothetical protein